MARELKQDKAVRILLNQGVRFDPRSSQWRALAEVRGDHGDYRVTKDEREVWTCDCFAARHSCSHILAAQTVYRAVASALREK